MKTLRTVGLSSLAALSCAMAAAQAASADDYPSRPVRIIFPFPTGSVADLTRVVADKLGERFKQPFVVENKPGATGNIGAESVARADPDGHTLMATPPPPLAVNQSLFARLGYDPAAFVPVTLIATMPNVLVAHPQLPASNVRELLDYAKANPDRLSYASTGNGGTPHLTTERFKSAGGVRILHVPYQGIANAMPDLVAGRVDIMFVNLSGVLPLIADGRLKALAVASAERLTALPATATVQETLPGFVSDTWIALAAPPKTPQSIIDKLAVAVREVLRMPDVAERFRQFGAVPGGGTPAESAAFIRQERERWAEVIRASGIKAE
jgi:tripartite-type tricarboxylate transporter receptor subunit TctC